MNKKEQSRKGKKAEGKKIKEGSFPVIGIGASAGGLEALEGFLKNMPGNSGLALIIIQHLDPKRQSIMDSLLEKYTDMKISVIKDGLKIMPDHIYLNCPNKDVSIINGTFQLLESGEATFRRLPIDHSFRSLSEEYGEKSICIVLSGTGTDGTQGLKAVKGAGGMTMAQDTEQAKYNGMPGSAIETGMVDFILPVESMPGELLKYIRHPYIGRSKKIKHQDQQITNFMNKIFLLLRSRTGHDFSNYKENTIRRRIEHRMAVNQIEKSTDYLHFLENNPSEAEKLFRDMLIGVTNFFRDREAFDFLKKKVMPEMLKRKSQDNSIRVWVPGCATGEEAYSLAIILEELIEKMKIYVKVQIFATDLDAEAVSFARKGIYPESIATDVSGERLKRFFIKEDGAFTVRSKIRDHVIFAEQNIIKDPPFSRLDLISCRNLLIYMDSALQKKILPIFHYILKKDGILFLGPSESIGEFSNYFSPVETKWKIFRHKKASLDMLYDYSRGPVFHSSPKKDLPQKNEAITGGSVQRLAEKIIIDNYAPPSVIVDQNCNAIYFIGETDMYLSPPEGKPSFNIVRMAREGLKYKLQSLLQEVLKKKKESKIENIRFKQNGGYRTIDLLVKPITDSGMPEAAMLVIFDNKKNSKPLKTKNTKSPSSENEDPRIKSLEEELIGTREYLQTTIEEYETSNEELKSANEELQSLNEELQSTNEELETSKEELVTVNSELQGKVNELSNANNDINNLLASTDIGSIFLDNNLKIKRYTPEMTKIFNLRQSDIGRPISDITSNLKYDSLHNDAMRVLDTLVRYEIEIIGNNSVWYSMRILPYRTMDNVIGGVVITFVDINKIKIAQEEKRQILEESENFFRSIVETVRDPILILDSSLKVLSANKAFYKTFSLSKDGIENRKVYELGGGEWNIPALRELLDGIIPEDLKFNDFLIEKNFQKIGWKKMLLNARRLDRSGDRTAFILLSIEDISIK